MSLAKMASEMVTWIFSKWNEVITMKEYIVIQKTSASKFQASLNDLHGDGYELVDFVVVSDDGEPIGWFGVMKLINIEPMVG